MSERHSIQETIDLFEKQNKRYCGDHCPDLEGIVFGRLSLFGPPPDKEEKDGNDDNDNDEENVQKKNDPLEEDDPNESGRII